ncbi:glycosyltransferase family 2 protein [Vibrio tapetis]|uniref:Putative Glycosyltransferase-like protein, family 2 n=1 Tax=Vibrio tapetis subsp. tapetis TaxID=1671868 RepID=A0A2N8ZGE2_9VIBR|nr:glycosyltransferase family 2 protein [Vibrio tapetis]SON50956.1 putative Glycosyltransferase-like protein, family 2 [Vibrio tapetis subsp. tapetis]
MSTNPVVSIVIPMYNAESYIRETLISIANQTYDSYEVIVVDNASTDSSLALVNEFSDQFSKLNVIKRENNSGGPAAPRNDGIEQANGELIAFVDADDVWEPSKLEEQVKCYIEDDANLICTNSRYIDEESEFLNKATGEKPKKNRTYGLKALLFRNTITTSSVVVSKGLLGDSRFNESKEMNTCEDYLLWLTVLNKEASHLIHLGSPLVRYRVMASSLGHNAGKRALALRSLMASSQFLIESKQEKYVFIVLFSNLLRFARLSLLGLK